MSNKPETATQDATDTKYVSTATMARPGHIIFVDNPEDGTSQYYFLASRSDQSTETAYLCIPIIELDDDTVEEIKKFNVNAKALGENPRFFFQMNQQSGPQPGFTRAAGKTKEFHYGLDIENPTILVDNPRVSGKKQKPENFEGTIRQSIKLSGTLGQILQLLSNRIIGAEQPTINIFRDKYNPIGASEGKRFNYDNIIGTYKYDMVGRDIDDWKKRRDANANIREHGSVHAPRAASAE